MFDARRRNGKSAVNQAPAGSAAPAPTLLSQTSRKCAHGFRVTYNT